MFLNHHVQKKDHLILITQVKWEQLSKSAKKPVCFKIASYFEMIIFDFPVSQFNSTNDCVIQVIHVILKTLPCNSAHFKAQLLSQTWSVSFVKINNVIIITIIMVSGCRQCSQLLK